MIRRRSVAEGSVQVEVCTIDSLLESLDISSIEFIKIDVQGFEGHVFKGMKRTLQQSVNLTLLSEFWPFGLRSAGSDPEEVLNELEAAGLTLHELNSRGTLSLIENKQEFIGRFPGRRYTNIVGLRGDTRVRG